MPTPLVYQPKSIPSGLVFSKNPVKIGFYTDAFLLNSFTGTLKYVEFADNFDATGMVMAITFGTQTVSLEFISGAENNSDPNQMPTNTLPNSQQSLGLWGLNLLIKFSAHPILADHFELVPDIIVPPSAISGPYLQLQFKAKTETANFFEIVVSNVPGSNVVDVVAGQNAALRSCKIVGGLLVESEYQSGVYDQQAVVSTPVIPKMNLVENATSDIQESLDSLLAAKYESSIADNLPTIGVSPAFAAVPDVIKRCKVQHHLETLGSPLTVRYTEPVFYAYLGGLSHRHFPGHDFFLHALPYQFLTNQPEERSVTPEQVEFLSFCLDNRYGNSVDVTLCVDIEFEDRTTETIEPVTGTATPYQVLSVPVGYDQLALSEVNLSKTIYKWTVYVKAGPDQKVLTNKQTFYRVQSQQYHRYLLVRNSLGVYDTIRVSGKRKVTAQGSRSIFDYKPELDYVAEQAQSVASIGSIDESVKVSIGYLETKEELEHIRELLHSKYLFEVDMVNNELVPIVITDSKIDLVDESDLIPSVELTYKYAFSNKSHSVKWK